MKANKILKIFLYSVFILGGIICILLLFKANEKLKAQARHQQLQILQQAEQIESIQKDDRQGLIGNLMDKIDDELQDNPKRILSDETIARIAALCYSFKPYSNVEGDSLSVKKFSPERGQLLLVLSKMNLDSLTIKKIMHQTSFSGAVLRQADLSGADLSGANLSGADLHDANLTGTNFYETDLREADLWGANLSQANLNKADLTRADLRWTNLNGAQLKKADLSGSSMNSSQMIKTDLQESVLQWANLNGAFLHEVNLTRANMFTTTLIRAHLEKSNLTEANLTWVDLTEANLIGVNWTKANLTCHLLMGAIVSEKNWLSLLDEWHVKGAEQIQKTYKLVKETSQGSSQYRLEKIKK